MIGWQNRYITRQEGLKLQSLEGIALPEIDNAAFRALGNAVNAKIVKLIACELIQTSKREKTVNGNKYNRRKIVNGKKLKGIKLNGKTVKGSHHRIRKKVINETSG